MLAPECIEAPHNHIYYLLGWRYSLPAVSGNLTDSEGETMEMVQGWARSSNSIDRAVWAANYMHVEHAMLQYNQPADT
jgi:hypothetical protein